MKLNILGASYEVIMKKYDEDKLFAKQSIAGYCNHFLKLIVVCDMTTYEGSEDDPKKALEMQTRENLRHEIVHAFLGESGLFANSNEIEGPWALNEEMVDWFAIQGPKIYKAWKEAGALETE